MTRPALCLLLLAAGASTHPAHAEPVRQLSPHEPNPNLHPHWRLGAGLMRGMSCEQDRLEQSA
ncbi:Uncharacterised protein [Pseudomonas putida]|nr:Uncharacterised protein [Pseudomonas putida]